MMRFPYLMAALASLTAVPAFAGSVSECDDYRSALIAIAEPWEQNTIVFPDPEGDVRLVVIDTYGPASAPIHLVILSPPFDMDSRQCKVVSLAEGRGFADLSLSWIKADTDGPVMTFAMPARRWISENDTYIDAKLTVTLNKVTGEITSILE